MSNEEDLSKNWSKIIEKVMYPKKQITDTQHELFASKFKHIDITKLGIDIMQKIQYKQDE